MAAADLAALRVLGVPVLVLALLLTGCGPADTAAPSTAATASTPSTPSTAAPNPPTATSMAPTSTEGAASRDASGPSFGVDRADWPDTEKGAKALLASLPKELGGESLELGDPRDHSSGADYGTLGTIFVQTEDDPEIQEGPDRLAAQQLLLAGFGLGAVCAEGTYRGTAAVPVLRKGEQEGALAEASPGVQDGSTSAWFSCRPVMEDDEWGHAVGWTSGTTAWQLYARDEQAARTLVSALHEAAAEPAVR